MLSKASHGTMNVTLLWGKLFTENLIKDGFRLNLSDLCTSNKMDDIKKDAITHHVNDAKKIQ